MRNIIVPTILILMFMSGLHASDVKEPLLIEMSDPKVRITIPGMPRMEMAVHPMNEHTPYFRLRGNSGNTSVSIIILEIDEANTAISCASEIANAILAQDSVSRDQVFLGKANEQTFLIIYGLPVEQSVVLNAHIVSSGGAGGCIEAHVSKVSTSDSDIGPWFNAFGDSNIENL